MFEKLFGKKNKGEMPKVSEDSQDDLDEEMYIEDPFGEYDSSEEEENEPSEEEVAETEEKEDESYTEPEFDLEEYTSILQEEPQQTIGSETQFEEDQVEQLLARDKEEDYGFDGFEDLDSSLDFVKDIGIYNAEETETETEPEIEIEEIVKDPNKLLTFLINLPLKTLYKIVGVMSGILVIVLIFAAVVFFIGKGNISKEKITLEIPNYSINSSNFIMVNETKQFRDDVFSVKKLSINELATTFYFDKNIDVETLDMMLVDDQNRVYSKDLNFMKYESGRNEHLGAVLTFKPLSSDVKSFSLSLYDPSTTEKVEYDFKMKDRIVYPSTIYVNKGVEALSNTDSFSLKVDSATFSSSSSSVYFSLKWNGNSKMKLGNANHEGKIELTELGSPTSVLSEYPSQYFFEDNNTFVGRMDFKPIKNLTNKVSISFKELCEIFEIGEEINAAPLFKNSEESQYTITKGNYDIVLERMGSDRGRYILVTHTKHKQPDMPSESNEQIELNEPLESIDDSRLDLVSLESRVENQLDVDLVITNSSGQKTVLEGIVYAVEAGADIVFDTRDLDGSFRNVPKESLKLIVNSGYIKYPVITIPI